MGDAVSSATLNGHRVTNAHATIPAWGRWYAEATLDSEVTLTGKVTLTMADLSLVGDVMAGGPMLGRSSFRIVGGGGWGREVAAKSYANDATTKRSKVLGDAAVEVGESLVDSSSERVGANYVRDAGPASLLLNKIAPRAWYVDEAGTTRLGARAAGALVGKVTRVTPIDRVRGKVVLAAESIATILPGVVVDGMSAVDVLHEITPETGLRSTVWGAAEPSTLDALADLIRLLDPDRDYRGVTEYRVDTITGSRLNLQPVRVSSGMPELKLVPVRPGVAGCEATQALGARVIVGFVDSDPSRPYVCQAEDADGDRFVPTLLKLCGGSDFVALASKVDSLFSTIAHATPVANDGGAAILATLNAALASVAASKVKAS